MALRSHHTNTTTKQTPHTSKFLLQHKTHNIKNKQRHNLPKPSQEITPKNSKHTKLATNNQTYLKNKTLRKTSQFQPLQRAGDHIFM